MEQDARISAPLITLFERDDAIAVPLLSQLRMAGYDVRSARTPVELFDILGKNLVTLVLVDLGAATAGRREFWVALDAQRRGRAMQVLTFRYMSPVSDLDLDFEPSARAIADVEIHGAHEFQRVIEAIRQRAPLHGPAPAAGVSYAPDGAIQPLGAALGIAPTPYGAQMEAAQAAYAASPSQQPGYGYAPVFGGQAFSPSMSPGNSPSAPSGGFTPPGYAAMVSGQFGGQMETTPFSEGNFAPPSVPFGQPYQSYMPSQPFGQSFPAQPSPFAHPTAANPFATNVETSPFSQPYGSNPFAQAASAPAASPASPFGPGRQPGSNPLGPGGYVGAPASPVSSAPSSWGVGSGGYVADAPGFAGWRTPDNSPDSFSSDPGAQDFYGSAQPLAMTQRSQPAAHPPVFQDSWTPPDDMSDMETGVLPEDAFQSSLFAQHVHPVQPVQSGASVWAAVPPPQSQAPAASQYATQERPWDAPRASSGDLPTAAPAAPATLPSHVAFEGSTATIATPVSAMRAQAAAHAPTPTDTALGNVLVEGALLTPHKLETLRGIQEMLASVNQSRKLGELAVMFKFLSSDQLLAALLVSRGLVSPQQIASLGRVKQEMAATGMDHDLETLLVRYNILPAEQLRKLRQELAS